MDMQLYFNAVMSEIKLEAKAKAESKGAMSGYSIIAKLSKFNNYQEVIIRLDNEYFTEDVISNFVCDSWRGSYDLPAISYDKVGNTHLCTIDEIINNINNSHGKEVTGYKGGNFVLSMNDILYIANDGDSNYSTAIVDIIEENGVIVCITKTDMY